jgi:hypothetical protein
MNSEDFKASYLDEDGDCVLPGTQCVWQSDEIVEHKMTYVETVYEVRDQFFKIIRSHSNSGYWSDSESYEPVVYEVKPVQKTITVYE